VPSLLCPTFESGFGANFLSTFSSPGQHDVPCCYAFIIFSVFPLSAASPAHSPSLLLPLSCTEHVGSSPPPHSPGYEPFFRRANDFLFSFKSMSCLLFSSGDLTPQRLGVSLRISLRRPPKGRQDFFSFSQPLAGNAPRSKRRFLKSPPFPNPLLVCVNWPFLDQFCDCPPLDLLQDPPFFFFTLQGEDPPCACTNRIPLFLWPLSSFCLQSARPVIRFPLDLRRSTPDVEETILFSSVYPLTLLQCA